MRDVSNIPALPPRSPSKPNGKNYHPVSAQASSKRDPVTHDAVIAVIPESILIEPDGPFKGNAGRSDAALFNGFMFEQGYWWVGGDRIAAETCSLPTRRRSSSASTKSRRSSSLKLYAIETPMRIDCIWISTTQKRGPRQHGMVR